MKRPPTRRQDEPIRAVKAACVVLGDGDRAHFVGVGRGEPYSVDDRARCIDDRCPGGGPGHMVPAIGGTCGFYAFGLEHDERPELRDGLWRLDVELFGRVVRHRLGYRAERQRVLSARAPTRCQCGTWARWLVVHFTGEISARCPLCVTDAEWLPVSRSLVANWLGCEVTGWHLLDPQLAPRARPPAPVGSDGAAAGGAPGSVDAGGRLAALFLDELPGELREAMGGQPGQQYHQKINVPFRISDYLALVTQVLSDSIEITLTWNHYPIWRRRLLYGRPWGFQ